ncbi:cupredoxin domain-containing protein, partial [Methanobacterium sp.]|uniref:cupredoxin domain-containing protein n=1 Tax=Methanobacterium sp. TaxID=2164 RepID=UPI003C7662E9
KAGTRVTWIVKDDSNNKYMVTSNANGSVEGKYLFMSDHLANGQSFSYTFNKIGTYGYYDMDHMDNKNLTGTIIVQ